ncbi:ADP-ribosylation factor-like protein [Rhodotorula paludigena]|uniref:ADP-ribosylation factor-like protein n=1 Tax=Rhodotorula paludigena TaxID=86838 RepID=UPI0031722C74
MIFRAFFDWLRALFWSTQLDVACIGLQNAGKTSLVNVLTDNAFSESMIPTVGFNLRKVQKGNVTIKMWDLAGQPRFRSIWERYCRGVNAIVWVLDSADRDTFATARSELHALLEKPELRGIPLLVLANKNDIPDHASVDEVIKALALATITNREVSCYSISAKSSRNIDITVAWLTKRS